MAGDGMKKQENYTDFIKCLQIERKQNNNYKKKSLFYFEHIVDLLHFVLRTMQKAEVHRAPQLLLQVRF